MKLDDKDRAIISMYAKNPDVSQEEIGEVVDLSQPSVAARVRKLKEGGAIETPIGDDYEYRIEIKQTSRFNDEIYSNVPISIQLITYSDKFEIIDSTVILTDEKQVFKLLSPRKVDEIILDREDLISDAVTTSDWIIEKKGGYIMTEDALMEETRRRLEQVGLLF